ncbi:ComF family protein [Rhodoferax sp.]|uniref:ComF family protein n=1 Tax=Rhodoferax sp. TaxID=50421 RepID=UPI00284D524D|nr:ComF family protein [Rhodoferax sp.]MDR3370465.1 ComF family protein [Rhodoferax sp.]
MFAKLISGVLPQGLKLSALPSQCRVCHSWPAQPVCEACVGQFAQPHPRCISCALPLPAGMRHCGACLKNPPPLDRCLAAVAYAYPWQTLIQDYKFHAEPGLVRSFATLLRAAPWVEPALDEADLLLPMPLSAVRLKERGYNQALLLARQLEPKKTRADVLLRIQDTPAQHTLKRAERLTALNHAFAVEPLLASVLKGLRVVLVDDVMTTGASLYTAARVLKTAGASHVTGLVIARTE